MKWTRIQKISLALLFGYLVWEIALHLWMRRLPPHDPVLRVDLLIIYPILLIFLGLSIWQFWQNKSN